MECITISDDDDDWTDANPNLADVSVQVIGHVEANRNSVSQIGTSEENSQCYVNKDQSIIDLTDGDESFRQAIRNSSNSEGYSSRVSSPLNQHSSEPFYSCQEYAPPSTPPQPRQSSPPLIPPPTPSPPPRPSSFSSNTNCSTSPTKHKERCTKKRRSPTDRARKRVNNNNDNESPTKTPKPAREEARRLKQQELEKERLFMKAKRENAVCRQNENCITNVDRNVLNIIKDPDHIYLDVLFNESNMKYSIVESTNIKDTVRWTYKHTEVDGIQLVTQYYEGHWTMIVIDGSDYLKRILTYRDDPNDSQSLKSFICDILQRNARDSKSNLILLVYSLAETLKAEKKKEEKNYRKNFRDRFEGNGTQQPSSLDTPVLCIGPKDLQDLRLTLEIDIRYHHPCWKMHVEFHEKTEDAVKAILRYTQSMAKASREQTDLSKLGIDWAIDADKERAFDPTKSLIDLKKLWIKQLQQFTSLSLPIANAIAAEYPSPSALLDQYKQLTKEEAETLLAQIYVQKNFKKQIGQSISRRIHCFMTSKNPDIHIGFGDEFLSST